MIVTEEDAKTKFCPRLAVNPECDIYCIASDCMHWRWFDEEYEYSFTETDGWEQDSYYLIEPFGIKKRNRWRKSKENRRGYCGLSGKPKIEETS